MTPLGTLRALGTGDEAPAEAKARVYGALLTSLETAAVTAATVAAVLPKHAPSLPPPAAVVVGAASSKAVAVAVGIWLLGGVTGAALYGALRPPQVHVVYLERPTRTSSAAPANAPQIALSAAVLPPLAVASNAAASRSASALAAPSAPASAAAAGSELARERALLDRARASAAQGEPALALEEAERHRQQFPHGHLTEEREALAIRALLALGRRPEARDRAQAFRSAYPNSFLMPVIASALSAP